MESDQEKRKKLVWEIERKLAEDGARPIIFYGRAGHLLAAAGEGADHRWSTASSTAGAWKTSGSTSRPQAFPEQREWDSNEQKFWLLAAAAGRHSPRSSSPDLAFAQKQGGILKVYFFDSPASMSIHEEATIAAEGPMMGVFNNLVMYQAGRAAKRAAIDRARTSPASGHGTRTSRS